MTDFRRGQKVRLLPKGNIFDFGYYTHSGNCVIYEEGECNMQDAIAVPASDLRPVVRPQIDTVVTLRQVIAGVREDSPGGLQVPAIDLIVEYISHLEQRVDNIEKVLAGDSHC